MNIYRSITFLALPDARTATPAAPRTATQVATATHTQHAPALFAHALRAVGLLAFPQTAILRLFSIHTSFCAKEPNS